MKDCSLLSNMAKDSKHCEGAEYFLFTNDFPEAFVTTDHMWNDVVLSEQFYSPAAMDNTRSDSQQSTDISQISSSSLQNERFNGSLPMKSRFEGNSAFMRYKKQRQKRGQLKRASEIKQKSLKSCFDFLKRMNESMRSSRSRMSVGLQLNTGLVEDSYAFTHMMSERNRRTKLTREFLALRSLLPQHFKKEDRLAILANARTEMNKQKLRIGELERRNQALMNAFRGNINEGCSSLSQDDDDVDAVLMPEEALHVEIEESNIPDEAIIRMEVTLKAFDNHIDAVISLLTCLRELKVEVLAIQCREVHSTKQVIQAKISRRTKGEGWGIYEREMVEEAVKRAVTEAAIK